MGKYAATKGIQNNKSWRSTARSIRNGATGNFESKEDYGVTAFLYNADPTGLYRGIIQARDSTSYMSDYLQNRGLDWSDIKYPSLTVGFSGYSSLGNSSLMISKNVARLYE